jgi:hypothetical protein
MLIQLKFNGRGSRSLVSSRSIGSLAMALVCGSLVAACSGTIETPTEEFPSRSDRNAAAADDDDDAPAAPAPRPTAQANTPARPVVNEAEDEDEPAAVDPEEEVEAVDPEEEEEEPAAEPAGDVSFASDVQPIFNTGCGPCHVSLTSGGQNIGSEDLGEAFDDSVAFEDAVLRDIASGRMPIGCGGPPGSGGNCISEEDFATIEAWYAAGAPE